MPSSSLTALLRSVDVKFCSGRVFVLPQPKLRRTDTNSAITTVDELLDLCVQAPCGVDGQTVTDTNVRRTMKVGKDRVAVEWPHLDGALAEIAFQLGIPGTVTAELHDVLVYRSGDFFKPHVDSIKHPDHRATLAVDTGMGGACSGGQLIADGNTWTSSGAGSYAAWFTNVMHEVTPVASGMRVVVTFNILSPFLPGTARAMSAGDVAGIDVVYWPTAPIAIPNDKQALQELVGDVATSTTTSSPWGSFVDTLVGYLQGKASEYSSSMSPPPSAPMPPPAPAPDLGEYMFTPPQPPVSYIDTVVDVTPKTYVGFLPLRQYYGDGRIDFRQLNGADRLLMVAIHKAFSVPIEEVQVWKQFWFDGEYPPGQYTPTSILADSRVEQQGDQKQAPLELISDKTYRSCYDRQRDYFSCYGSESHKVRIVDGVLDVDKFIIGSVMGNDAGEPLYAYHSCYIRFPLTYLRDYLQSTTNAADHVNEHKGSRREG